jgi:hypothetical protein
MQRESWLQPGAIAHLDHRQPLLKPRDAGEDPTMLGRGEGKRSHHENRLGAAYEEHPRTLQRGIKPASESVLPNAWS